MVIFRKSYPVHAIKKAAKNLREFKMEWLNTYCGTIIRAIQPPIQGGIQQCYLVPMTKRNRCTWCSCVRNERSNTKTACNSCNNGHSPIYFCNPAQLPCYFQAHQCDVTKEKVVEYAVQYRRKRMRSTIMTQDGNDRTIYVGRQQCIQLPQHI